MNIKECLLTCANEESLEIGHAADKALRFGFDNMYPGTGKTNRDNFIAEVNDLIGVLELIQENGVELPNLFDRSAIDSKKSRVNKYMSIARELGTLQ